MLLIVTFEGTQATAGIGSVSSPVATAMYQLSESDLCSIGRQCLIGTSVIIAVGRGRQRLPTGHKGNVPVIRVRPQQWSAAEVDSVSTPVTKATYQLSETDHSSGLQQE